MNNNFADKIIINVRVAQRVRMRMRMCLMCARACNHNLSVANMLCKLKNNKLSHTHIIFAIHIYKSKLYIWNVYNHMFKLVVVYINNSIQHTQGVFCW